VAPTDDTQGTFNDELKGALLRNDKGGNSARPDYRGRCVIENKGYRISAWVRTAKNTQEKYLSLAYTRDETLDPGNATPDARAAATADADLPF
jgi:hypothetical protein